jgi:hypothetical protein
VQAVIKTPAMNQDPCAQCDMMSRPLTLSEYLDPNFKADPEVIRSFMPKRKIIDLQKVIWKREEVALARRSIRAVYCKIQSEVMDAAGGKCTACGYCKHKIILQFHHLDPSLKDTTISSLIVGAARCLHSGRPVRWGDIVKEIKKCRLLCPTCHAEQHMKKD